MSESIFNINELHLDGLQRIAAERERVIKKGVFPPEHDDAFHTGGELAMAAAYYAALAGMLQDPPSCDGVEIDWEKELYDGLWPFEEPPPTKSKTLLRALEISGQFIVAEIDRLRRKEIREAAVAPGVESEKECPPAPETHGLARNILGEDL